ncbi:DNA/RNA-binding protein KIN17 [Hondaea fermentalgiana]|uniref:DNA/RNA-binding protein KIN17 n=1 Tax=Hondaea fermentalgiana TaxID=2315210 RepID=A0A2R5GFJ5_9STRA|nr:DNA/RNA-binding protein KIN17 [Hondaea fermentalgiana]|eukprot:GBG29099.1 DNA/RNA-binding protein KIN17 [Hondaea fermentalgiana]
MGGKSKQGKALPGSAKAVANKMKARGLGKLRFYCQMCEKQCRDENGFKCHCMSEAHIRKMQLFASNQNKFLDEFSSRFEKGYVDLLSRRHQSKFVDANAVYNEYIQEREHVHMNATRWATLTQFVKYLVEESIVRAEETERGFRIQWINRDPTHVQRQLDLEKVKKRKFDLDDEDRRRKLLEMQQKALASTDQVPVVAPSQLDESSRAQLGKVRVSLQDASALRKRRRRLPQGEANGLIDGSWLVPGLVVKIISSKVGNGNLKKCKAIVVRATRSESSGKVKAELQLMDDPDEVVWAKESHLETVLPDVGGPVLIVSKKSDMALRGQRGIMKGLLEDQFKARVCVQGSSTDVALDYENVCRYFDLGSGVSQGPVHVKEVAYPVYDEAEAKAYCERFPEAPAELAIRCYTSNLIGREASLVLHGGGNTSVKLKSKTRVGDEVDVLCVKGSGYNLDSIIPKGFPQVDLVHLRRLLELDSMTDPEMVNEFRTHMLDASSPNPSVETLLHALLPARFVDHSHADAIVALADHSVEEATRLFTEAFGGELKFAVVPYHIPGFPLAGAARKVLAEAGDDLDCLILLKHGLFTWGEEARDSYEKHIKAVNLAERYLASREHNALTLRPRKEPSAAFFDRATSVLRGVFAEFSGDVDGGAGWILAYRDSPEVAAFAQSEECDKLSQIGCITPDHVIRTKQVPLVIRGLEQGRFYGEGEDPAGVAETPEGDKALRTYLREQMQAYVDRYHEYFRSNNERVGGTKQELDPLPRVLLVEHFGLFTVARDAKSCSIAADIYEHTVPTLVSSLESSGTFEPVNTEEIFDVEYWSLEQAKLKLGAKAAGALHGKVALITGGGSGIGLQTAVHFAKAGASVFIVDLLPERVSEGVAAVAQATKNKFAVAGAIADVSDPAQVEEAFHKLCVAFGGVDIVVSNAGIVVQAAPGLASVDPAALKKSMDINFYGHHWVSSAGVRRMVAQGTGGALLYNISKAPLNPGPKLGPYCVAKAAALGLMRQYCVEYGDRGIRSNAVNADRVRTNLFDIALVEKRAQARGLTAEQYFKSNLLSVEVSADDVAQAFLSLATARSTTGSIYTVDGGNIAAAPR